MNWSEGGVRVNFAPDSSRQARSRPRSPQEPAVQPFSSVDEAIAAVDALDSELDKFELAVADSLQDHLGVQMAQINDRALARGWEPLSFVQQNGFRRYRYKAMR